MIDQWFKIEGINPQPWQAAKSALGRRGGRPFIMHYSPDQMRVYQEAVRELFPVQNPHYVMRTGLLDLEFYFWRRQEEYETYEGKRKKVTSVADATNLQKCLEDALQGILYENDRNNVSVRSEIIDQDYNTDPCIVIGIGQARERPDIEMIRESIYLPEQKPHEEFVPPMNILDIF